MDSNIDSFIRSRTRIDSGVASWRFPLSRREVTRYPSIPIPRDSSLECVIDCDDSKDHSIGIQDRQSEKIEISHASRDGDHVIVG